MFSLKNLARKGLRYFQNLHIHVAMQTDCEFIITAMILTQVSGPITTMSIIKCAVRIGKHLELNWNSPPTRYLR